MSRPSTKKRQSTRALTFNRVSSDSRKRVLPTSKKATTSNKATASHTTPDAAGPSRTPRYSTRSRTRAVAGHGGVVHDDVPPPSSIRRKQASKGKAPARAPEPTNDVEEDASKFTLIRADLRDFEYFSEALLRDREDTGNMRCTIAVSEENGNDTIAIVFHQKNMGVPTINWNASSSPTDSTVDIWDYMRTASENDTAYRIVHELKALRSTNYFSLRDELSDDADQAAAKARILDFQRRQQDIFARQDKSAGAQGSLDALRNTDMVVDGIYGRIAQHFSSPALESRYQKNMLFRDQDKILRELGIPLEARYPSRTELEDDAVLCPPLSPGDEAQPISVPFPFRSKKRARDPLESDADEDDAGTASRYRKRPRRQALLPRAKAGSRIARSGVATRWAGPAGGSTAKAQAFPTPPTDEPAAGPSTVPESTVEPSSQRTTKDRKGKARAAPPAGRFSQYIKDEDLSDTTLGMSLGWKILTAAEGQSSLAQIAEGKARADDVEAGAVPKMMDAVGLEDRATRIVESDDVELYRRTKRRRTTRKR